MKNLKPIQDHCSIPLRLVFAWVLYFALNTQLFSLLAQGTAFTYQGRLDDAGQPAHGIYDFRFTIYDSASGGTAVAGPITNSAVAVTNGLFTVSLDFGAGVFTGPSRWLEIAVHTNGGATFTTLTPRQAILPAPYAITASNLTGTLPASQLTGTLPSANLAGTYSGAVTFNNPANSFTGNGAGLTELNASALSSGTVPDARLSANVARTNQVWLLSGNAGTTPGTHFLGTTDNQPLELRVNNQRALRLVPNASGAPNVIGGSPGNFVGAGVAGATIAGGGVTNYSGAPYTNSVLSDFGVVGGGRANTIAANSDSATIAGGAFNDIGPSAWYSTIGGGYNNNIAENSTHATIAGGDLNTIAPGSAHAVIAGGYRNAIGTNAEYSAIGGGYDNNIAPDSWLAAIVGGCYNDIGTNAHYSVVGGGYNNNIAANAAYATIPGGRMNLATNFAFAAGNRAKAIHTGAFVWGDSTEADFASTAANQFLVRAAGGVGINTNNPQSALHVNGIVTASGFSGPGATLTQLNASALATGTVPDARLSANVSLLGPSIESAEITDGTIAPADLNVAAFNTTFWRATGNAGTAPGTHFLGTTDDQPIEIKVNNPHISSAGTG